MITLSDLNKAAQVKKAAQEALAATAVAGKKVLSVAEAAKEAVAGVWPASNSALAETKHDILMVVADVQQRVESIEEELHITTEVDEMTSEVIVEGYMAIMEARRKHAKDAKKAEAAKAKEIAIAKEMAPVEVAPVAEVKQAKAPVKSAPKVTGTRPRIKFDDIPKI